MAPSKKWESKPLVEPKPESNNPMDFPSPLRCWIMGPSGSGKSQMSITLLKYLEPFNYLFYFAPNLDNGTIAKFREICDEMKENNPDIEIIFSCEPEDIPSTADLADIEGHKVLVIDDFVDCPKKVIQSISQLATQSRGTNTSCIFISHFYTGTGDLLRRIRNNCNFFFLFSGLTADTIKLIARQYVDVVHPDILYKFYKSATDRPGRFITIDRTTTNNNFKVRLTPDQPVGNRLIADSKTYSK